MVFFVQSCSTLNISNFPPGIEGPSTPKLLESFRQAARTSEAVSVTVDSTRWRVQGVGVMPHSQREVAWVDGGDARADTTSAFVHALASTFSSGITAAVARELELQPAPGRPLSSRTVTQALDMAETGQQAMSGVDFFTRLQFSAVADGAEFRRVCASLGRDTNSISVTERQRIDAQLDRSFEQARMQGTAPVGYDSAESWLLQALG